MRVIGGNIQTCEGSRDQLRPRGNKRIEYDVRAIIDRHTPNNDLLDYLANMCHADCVLIGTTDEASIVIDEHVYSKGFDIPWQERFHASVMKVFNLLNSSIGWMNSTIQPREQRGARLVLSVSKQRISRRGAPGDGISYVLTLLYEGYAYCVMLANSRGYHVLSNEQLALILDPEATHLERNARCLNMCHECGGAVEGDHSSCVCQDCIDEFHLIKCEACGRWETPDRVKRSSIHCSDGVVLTMGLCSSCRANYRSMRIGGQDGVLFYCEGHERYEFNIGADYYDASSRWIPEFGRVCDPWMDEAQASGRVQTCEVCGTVIHDASTSEYPDADGRTPIILCYECAESAEKYEIISNFFGRHNYSFKPLPAFVHGDWGNMSYVPKENTLYLGVELEFDNASDNEELAYEIHTAMEGTCYCKSDCSLDAGIEAVTFPLEAQYAVNNYCWQYIIDCVREYNGEASSTCGFHVHVNRDFFGEADTLAREIGEAKFVYLFDKFYDQLRRIGKRDGGRAYRWAAPSNIILTPDMEGNINAVKDAKGMCSARYSAVNLQNESTLEVRLWKSTLDVEAIKNLLDLTQAMVYIAKNYDLARLIEMDVSGLIEAVCEFAEHPETVGDFMRGRL